MRFSASAILLSTFAALAAAQTNPFTKTSYSGITAGVQVNITWSPTTDGTVTLKLVQGDPSALTPVSTLGSGLPNSGFYLWTPSATLVAASNYALEIISDANTNWMNWTPQFAIASSGTGPAPSGGNSTVITSTTAVPFGNTTTLSPTGRTTSTTTRSSGPTATTSGAAVNTNGAAAVGAPAKIGAGILGMVGAFMMAL